MPFKKHFTVLFCLFLVTIESQEDNEVNSDQDEDTFDVLTFTKGYFDVRKPETLTYQDALGLIVKLSDSKKDGRTYAKMLEDLYVAADKLASQMDSCELTKSIPVHNFIDAGSIDEHIFKIKMLSENWICPSKQDPNSKNKFSQNLTKAFQQHIFDEIKKRLKNDPKSVVQDILDVLKSHGILSKDETNPMVVMIAEQLSQSESTMEYVIMFVESFEFFFNTESGQNLFTKLPHLMASDKEKAMELVSDEIQTSKDALFGFLSNSEFAEQFTQETAKMVISLVNMAKDALNDNFKFAIANSMLISNKFPPLDRHHLAKSSCEVIEKLASFLTTSKLELNLHDRFKIFASEFENLYFKFDKFNSLTEEEIENVVSLFIADNLLQPGKDLWTTISHMNKHSECSEITLCLFNENHQKSNRIVKELVSILSRALVYVQKKPEDLDKLYEAISVGQGEKNCKEIYEKSEDFKKCDIFAIMKQRLAMNLNYGHDEL